MNRGIASIPGYQDGGWLERLQKLIGGDISRREFLRGVGGAAAASQVDPEGIVGAIADMAPGYSPEDSTPEIFQLLEELADRAGLEEQFLAQARGELIDQTDAVGAANAVIDLTSPENDLHNFARYLDEMPGVLGRDLPPEFHSMYEYVHGKPMDPNMTLGDLLGDHVDTSQRTRNWFHGLDHNIPRGMSWSFRDLLAPSIGTPNRGVYDTPYRPGVGHHRGYTEHADELLGQLVTRLRKLTDAPAPSLEATRAALEPLRLAQEAALAEFGRSNPDIAEEELVDKWLQMQGDKKEIEMTRARQQFQERIGGEPTRYDTPYRPPLVDERDIGGGFRMRPRDIRRGLGALALTSLGAAAFPAGLAADLATSPTAMGSGVPYWLDEDYRTPEEREASGRYRATQFEQLEDFLPYTGERLPTRERSFQPVNRWRD